MLVICGSADNKCRGCLISKSVRLDHLYDVTDPNHTGVFIAAEDLLRRHNRWFVGCRKKLERTAFLKQYGS